MTDEAIAKQLQIIITKINSLTGDVQKLYDRQGHASAELQRLRQIINKEFKK